MGSRVLLAAVAASVSCFAGGASAQTAAPNRTELTLCNKTGQRIDIAIAYQDVQTGRWTLSAWHIRNPGQCASFGNVKSGLFYYHAKNERNAVWPSSANTDRNWCVPSQAVRRDMVSKCGQGERNRPFRGISVNPGKFTFNFS
jgi:uncharacterized membrane protein